MSPFGKYGELIVTLVTAFTIVVAVLSHALGATGDLTFVDAAALLGLGALYGKTSAANGYAAQAKAANVRLDKINAPPANDGAG